MDEETAEKKICFVICPIGADDSPTRDRSDKVFNHIISPVVKGLGYEPMRSDHDSRPGRITNQIIRHLVDAPLVIADLTDQNPNVLYELAIRHMVARPFMHIMQKGQKLPFDVGENRTIFVDHTDLDSVANCMRELKLQIQEVEKDSSLVENPISVAIERRALDMSKDPTAQGLGEILSRLDQLTYQVNKQALERDVDLTDWSEIVADMERHRLVSRTGYAVFLDALNRATRDRLDSPLTPEEFGAAQEYYDKQGDPGLEKFVGEIVRKRIRNN